ncbi:MAG: hypothetical protein ACRDQY_05020, partial [Pseudonocardiaceae bacterium]
CCEGPDHAGRLRCAAGGPGRAAVLRTTRTGNPPSDNATYLMGHLAVTNTAGGGVTAVRCVARMSDRMGPQAWEPVGVETQWTGWIRADPAHRATMQWLAS